MTWRRRDRTGEMLARVRERFDASAEVTRSTRDRAAVVPSDRTAHPLETHIAVTHALCELGDSVLLQETREA